MAASPPTLPLPLRLRRAALETARAGVEAGVGIPRPLGAVTRLLLGASEDIGLPFTLCTLRSV